MLSEKEQQLKRFKMCNPLYSHRNMGLFNKEIVHDVYTWVMHARLFNVGQAECKLWIKIGESCIHYADTLDY